MLFFDHPSMLSSLEDRNDFDRIVITDIHSIEYLFSIKNKNLDIILDGFLSAKNAFITASLYDYCIQNYPIKFKDGYRKTIYDFTEYFKMS
mgnify:CR=1 FL=1